MAHDHSETVENGRPSGATFGEVVEEVLELIHAHLPECLVYVTQFDTDANVLRILSTRGDSSFGLVPGLEKPLDSSFCYFMAADLSPRVSLDTASDPNYSRLDPDGSLPAYMGWPMELGDGTRVGSLCVVSADGGQIDPEVRPMISTFSRSLSLALELEADAEHLRKANARLAIEATTDALTGVSTRRQFHEQLERTWHLARRGTLAACLLLMDLDRLKQINDAYGHGTGDLALVDLAEVLEGLSRRSDPVGRLGGDEFAIIVDGCDSNADSRVLTARIADSFSERARARGLDAGVSVGSCLLTDAASPEEALELADRAMYANKPDSG